MYSTWRSACFVQCPQLLAAIGGPVVCACLPAGVLVLQLHMCLSSLHTLFNKQPETTDLYVSFAYLMMR
jgi:hypothetical protein